MSSFIRIVEAGSLSAAAQQLGTSQPTMSRRLQTLERLLGTKLLQRSTHGMQLTEGGARFVTAVTFQALSGNPVWTDLWDPRMGNNMAHIDLTRDADAILIAPATADVMAKLVHGLADDLLTTLCLARDCPLLVAPAMNRQMWEHPATRRNAAQLVADGVTLFGPAAGEQACGDEQGGGMPGQIVDGVRESHRSNLQMAMASGPTIQASMTPPRMVGLLRASGKTVARP